MEKFEFLKNGSYCYQVIGDAVVFRAALRYFDEDGNLQEKVTVDMLSDMSVTEFEAKDLVTHIDGEIPRNFFPADLWEADEMGPDPEWDVHKMRPIFEYRDAEDYMDGIQGYAEDFRELLSRTQHQYFIGLRSQCPQAILVTVAYN